MTSRPVDWPGAELDGKMATRLEHLGAGVPDVLAAS
jgi:hypothetical protein